MKDNYQLDDLQDLIKPMWPQSYKWRLQSGNIEFALPTTYGDHWFPYSMAPKKITEFVRSWRKSGGLQYNEMKTPNFELDEAK